MDEAEQLCDRLVVMDSGQDRRRGIAARADRALLDARGGRAALRRRRHAGRLASRWSTGSSSRVEVLPDRVLLYTDDGDAASHGRARARPRPAERARAALHARGRLPPPHRPDPHRVSSVALALRPLEFFLTQYKRVWRGTARDERRHAGRLPARPRCRARRARRPLGRSPNGISYLEFVAPGLLAATAMQLATFEASFPVMAAIKWNRQYHAMLATPLARARRDDRPSGVRRIPARPDSDACTSWSSRRSARSTRRSACLRSRSRFSSGFRFDARIAAWAAHTENEVTFIAIFRFVILPMFLFSGTFFPIRPLPTPLEVLAGSRRSGTASTLCRDLTLGDVSPDDLAAPRVSPRVRDGRAARGSDDVSQEARRLMSELVARARLTAPARPALGGLLIIERNVMVYRRTWMILFSGFFEPLFYLFFFVYPLPERSSVTSRSKASPSSTRRSSHRRCSPRRR